MGFFSKAIKSVASPLGFVSTNPVGIGGLFNDLTGATSAAKTAQKYTLQNMAVTNQYQKEFAQNAHQWEAQDLAKAGYNPALTTGLGGASASGGGGASAGIAQGELNPINAISTIGDLINSTSATKADIGLKKAQAKATPIQAKADLINAEANARLSYQKGQSEKGTLSNLLGNIKDNITQGVEKKIKEDPGWKKGFGGFFAYRHKTN